jgi:hypothetical protein
LAIIVPAAGAAAVAAVVAAGLEVSAARTGEAISIRAAQIASTDVFFILGCSWW